MRKGFTLLEFAISLVIIGLIIGGVLVGRSMMATARINSAVHEISKIDADVRMFKDRSGYLPGDSPNIGGDGDGVVDAFDYSDIFGCEIANFFPSLDPETYPGYTACTNPVSVVPRTSGSSKNVPPSKLGTDGSFYIAAAMVQNGSSVADKANPRNYYAVLSLNQAKSQICAGFNQFTPTTSDNSAVTPANLLSFDKKIDDGIANSGIVISGNILAAGCGGTSGGIYNSPLATCSSGADYRTYNSGNECTPLIRLGLNSGANY